MDGPGGSKGAGLDDGLDGCAGRGVVGGPDDVAGGAGGPPGPVPLGRPSAAGGRAAVAAVREAAAMVAAGAGDALVTAPVSKEALRLAGYPWPGQTEMLADLCAAE